MVEVYNSTLYIQEDFISILTLRGEPQSKIEIVNITLGALVDVQLNLLNESLPIFRDIGRIDKVRYVLLFIICSFAILVPVLTIVSGILCWKTMSLWSSTFGQNVLIVVWIAFTLHFAASIVLADFCREVDQYVVNFPNASNSNSTISNNSTSNQLYETAEAALSLFMNCQNNGSLISGISIIAQAELSSAFNDLNNNLTGYDPHRNVYNYEESNYTNCLNLSFVDSNPSIFAVIQGKVDLLTRFIGLTDDINALVNCQYVANSFTLVRNNSCIGVLYSMELLWLCFLGLGFFEIFCTAMAICGYKRFRKMGYDKQKPSAVKKGIQVEMPQGLIEVDSASTSQN